MTAEEHSVIGGLGGAVCECLSENCPVPVRRVGIKDVFGASGKALEVAEAFGLSPRHICEAAEALIK